MGEQDSSFNLYQRLSRWRWQVPLLVFVSLSVIEIIDHWVVEQIPTSPPDLIELTLLGVEILVYTLIFPFLFWKGVSYLQESILKIDIAQNALLESHTTLEGTNARLEFLIGVNHRLASAEDEDALLEEITQLAYEVSRAKGCITILFDERKKPIRMSSKGENLSAVMESWDAHLTVNHHDDDVCHHCALKKATEQEVCPLLTFRYEENAEIKKVHCLILKRNHRLYGTISLFLADESQPAPHEIALLESMKAEMTLALETHHFRAKEIDTLFRLETTRRRENLHETLGTLIAQIKDDFEVRGGGIYLRDQVSGQLRLVAVSEQPEKPILALVQSLAAGTLQADAPLVISDQEQEKTNNKGIRSFLVAPLKTENQWLGSLILWAKTPSVFTRQRVRTLATTAGQIALLVENHRLYNQAERQATQAERTRLAREIHDGLAQTLGYLKLRASQIAHWIEHGHTQRALHGFNELRDLLGEAYLDAREAIDGLRVLPRDEESYDWMRQVVRDFQTLTHIPVELKMSEAPSIPLEVQFQLLRIIQEALSNIRKHAHANQVKITWQNGEQLAISIWDDGHGFDPQDVPLETRHGLLIMQERARLIGGSICVDSQWGRGTAVNITLPL